MERPEAEEKRSSSTSKEAIEKLLKEDSKSTFLQKYIYSAVFKELKCAVKSDYFAFLLCSSSRCRTKHLRHFINRLVLNIY